MVLGGSSLPLLFLFAGTHLPLPSANASAFQSAHFLLTTNDKTIKLWKVHQKQFYLETGMNMFEPGQDQQRDPASIKALRVPSLHKLESRTEARCLPPPPRSPPSPGTHALLNLPARNPSPSLSPIGLARQQCCGTCLHINA